jgi:hypothetical protein
MRILFDHGTPSGIAAALSAHEVTEARDRGWDVISNGDLLKAAEVDGFDLLLTTDKRIRYQQNLERTKDRHSGPWKLNLAHRPPAFG